MDSQDDGHIVSSGDKAQAIRRRLIGWTRFWAGVREDDSSTALETRFRVRTREARWMAWMR